MLHQTDDRGEPQLQVSRATPIVAEVSGRLVYWRTQAKTLGGALSEIGVTLDDGDQVLVNGVLTSPRDPLLPLAPRMVASALSLMRLPTLPPSDDHPLSVTVKRAVAFTVVEDGHSLSLRSTQPDLALALKENDIVLGPADLVSPDPETPLTRRPQRRSRPRRQADDHPARGDKRRLQPREDGGRRAGGCRHRPDAPRQGIARPR